MRIVFWFHVNGALNTNALINRSNSKLPGRQLCLTKDRTFGTINTAILLNSIEESEVQHLRKCT